MRVRRGILLLLIPLAFSACGDKDARKAPEELIPRDSFTQLLTEFYLLEGEVQYRKNNYGVHSDSAYPVGTKRLLEEFDTDRKTFQRSYRYYMKEPDSMKAIHEDVVNELMRRKGKKEE